MRRLIIVTLLAVLVIAPLAAQDDESASDDPASTIADDAMVTIDDSGLDLVVYEIVTEPDIFGVLTKSVRGEILNASEDALTNITLFADLLDGGGELVGEGIGFVVNACGSGLLPDFALQPGQRQYFSLALEIFEDGTTVESVEILPQVTVTDPVGAGDRGDIANIVAVSEQDVVKVEWISAELLRFGVGCDADAFTYLTWYEHNVVTGTTNPVEHPNAERVTDQFIDNLRIVDEFEYRRSYLDFAPVSGRVVFQSAVNHFYTANRDGSSRSFIWDNISRHSLHGIIWQDRDIFLAYYYGAYGEDVLYFTASASNGRISRSIYVVAPSQIIPGPNTFGTHVVIGTTFEDVTGYWYRHVFLTERRLLFEAELPGNNWPAPIYEDELTTDPVVYIARPVEDGTPRLQCFNMDTDELIDLTELPLNLTIDDRAWTSLSPDGSKMAVYANGVDGGMWIVDLAALPVCDTPVES